MLIELYYQFSLVKMCERESLCDIRRDCSHHFASERDIGRDAQRVCQAEKSLKSPAPFFLIILTIIENVYTG